MKNGKMKHEMAMFYAMGPGRNVLFQTNILFVTVYYRVLRFLVKLFAQDDACLF